MKKTIIYLLVAAFGLTGLSACHSDLDIIYDNALSASNMWQDPSDLEQSVPGLYERVRAFFSASEANVFYYGEVRVGDIMWGPSMKDKVQDNFKISCRHQTLTPGNTIGWANAYKAIDQANAILAHSGECKATETMVTGPTPRPISPVPSCISMWPASGVRSR